MTNVCGEDFSGVAKMKGERDDDYEPPRRHPEPRSVGHDLAPMSRSPRSDAYAPEDGLGLTTYAGGGQAQRGGMFSPPDREQRSRQRWGPFPREQDRDRPHYL
jgi:hypothetical protein